MLQRYDGAIPVPPAVNRRILARGLPLSKIEASARTAASGFLQDILQIGVE